jgi:hypothetical protein
MILDDGVDLLGGIGLLLLIGFSMFVILGPIIEGFLDIMLPPENWDDDDTDPV